MAKGINYNARNFVEVRTELINFVRQYYPELYSDFNDASIGQMLLELNAAVADMLSFNTDRMFQETQLDYAQERSSVLAMGRTLGLKIPGVRPSVSLVDFRVTVPPKGDTFDSSYCPIVQYGSQVQGGGQTFEVGEDINFKSPLSVGGIPNRLVIPNKNSNNVLVSYDLIKREVVVNGQTKILKQNIRTVDVNPFMEIVIPETNVISIEQIKMVDGLNAAQPTLSQFLDFTDRFYEVDSLAEGQIFIKDKRGSSDNIVVTPGVWVDIDKKFVMDYTDKGFCRLTFGSGTNNAEPLDNYLTNNALTQVETVLNNRSLGELPKANSTLYVRYRVGGGTTSNIGPNTLQDKGVINILTKGNIQSNNDRVNNSLRVNNVIPAIGGADAPNLEELRNLIRYNFASQNRAVTIRDYLAIMSKMNSKFGSAFRSGISENQNKIEVSTLGLGADGKLTNASTSTLRENVSRYLSNYRMINDYITITGGKILNIGIDAYVFIDSDYNRSVVSAEMITKVTEYFQVSNQEMGQNVYLADLSKELNNIDGVLNITEIKVYNKVGGEYSIDQVTQPYVSTVTREIDTMGDLTLYGNFNTMFEIKYAQSDIRVIAK